jgi:surfeit locus 1 family protein
VPALIILVGLGTWQLQRLEWKKGEIEALQTRSVAAAVALPLADEDLAKFKYQRVAARGRYRHDKEIYLVARSLRGSPGFHVLTPFVREDGGGAVLVNRGWVPFEKRSPETRLEGQIAGVVPLDGIVRLEKKPGLFTPDNDPVKNNWYLVDTGAMSDWAGIKLAPGYYVIAEKAKYPGAFPVGRQWRLDIRNDHLAYAITWYGLALALLVIYILYHRRQP